MATSSIVVWWASSVELVASFAAFAQRKDHKMLELGPGWLKDVRQQVTPAFAREASQLFESDTGKQFHHLVVPLLRTAPVGDAAGFLDWLGDLAVGELYERLVPLAPEGRAPTLPRDLGGTRDRFAR